MSNSLLLYAVPLPGVHIVRRLKAFVFLPLSD